MAAEALRDQVHGYLQSQGVYDEVRAVLRERASELDSAALAGMSQAEKVRHVLREAGVVDAVVNGLASGVEPPPRQPTRHEGDSADERKSAASAASAGARPSASSPARAAAAAAAQPDAPATASSGGGKGEAFPEDEDLVSLAAIAAASSADLSLRQGDGPRPLDPRRRYLRLHVQSGSAFLSEMVPDHQHDSRAAPTAAAAGASAAAAAGSRTSARPRTENSFLVLHACFRGQRFRGIPVPASVSPSFDEFFLLDLFPRSDEVPAGGGLRRLMASSDPLQLAVTRIVAKGRPLASASRSGEAAADQAAVAASAGLPAGLGELGGSAFRVELVSYACVEWRRVLATGAASVAVELPAAGTAGEAGLSAGALSCRLEIVPRTGPVSLADVSADGSRVPGMALPADVEARVAAIEQEQASASRRLFLAARRWWDGAVARRPDLRFRPVRIFAPDEGGVQRAVTSYVRPMRAGRLVESPRHAARLVALLPLRGHNPLGGSAGPSRRSDQRERADATAMGKRAGQKQAGPGRAGAGSARGRGRSSAALRPRDASGRAGRAAHGQRRDADEDADSDAYSDADSDGSPDAEFDEPDCAPWHSPFTVLAMRSGTAADHATLLCSLLRGFGLDAYVAVGTWVDARGVEGTHEWVVSLDDRSLDDAAGGAGEDEGGMVVRFWEPLTGERSAPDWPTTDGRRFRTIACLFNEEALLANVQPTSSVSSCSWDVRDEGKWMPFEQGAIGALAATLPPAPALCPPTVAEGPLAFALEQCLRAEALAWREEEGLPLVPFDPRLEHSLAPALAAYEAERLTGRPFGADDFRAAVRACVPPGHSFSAFPFQVGHASPTRLAAFMRASAVAEGVVCSRGEAVSLAVRVRVFAYAEDALAVWVIVASRCA